MVNRASHYKPGLNGLKNISPGNDTGNGMCFRISITSEASRAIPAIDLKFHGDRIFS